MASHTHGNIWDAITMNLLLLYMYDPKYDFDNWLHMKFAEYLAKTDGVNLVCYGPGLHEKYAHLIRDHYENTRTFNDLLQTYKSDAVILMTKAKMFRNYRPESLYGPGEHDCWLPADFAKVDIPVVVLEEDYHYETDDKWYQEMGVDVILQRHKCSSLRQTNVPMRWFPFSVDHTTFKCDGRVRHNKVSFVGSYRHAAYPVRKTAIKKLEGTDYFCMRGRRRVVGADYVNELRAYISHLCCTSKYSITPAKIFEIMASGSVLFINDDPQLRELFEGDCYVTYDNACSEVVAKARWLTEHMPESYRKTLVVNATKQILEKHTHDVRIQELLAIIRGI